MYNVVTRCLAVCHYCHSEIHVVHVHVQSARHVHVHVKGIFDPIWSFDAFYMQWEQDMCMFQVCVRFDNPFCLNSSRLHTVYMYTPFIQHVHVVSL